MHISQFILEGYNIVQRFFFFTAILLKFFLRQIWYLVTTTIRFPGQRYVIRLYGEELGFIHGEADSNNSLSSAP